MKMEAKSQTKIIKNHFDALAQKLKISTNYVHPLQSQAHERLLNKLDMLTISPQTVIEIGCTNGQLSEKLAALYPLAHIVGLDLSSAQFPKHEPLSSQIAKGVKNWFKSPTFSLQVNTRPNYLQADAHHLPFLDNKVDLIVCSLTLPLLQNEIFFNECFRVLKPKGTLLFSTVGPDTLSELKTAWEITDKECKHVNNHIDMHDIGDILLSLGFSDPVMDTQRLSLTYDDLFLLLKDIKELGSMNHTPRKTLTGKNRFIDMFNQYPKTSSNDYPCTIELIFGCAIKPARKSTYKDNTFSLPLENTTLKSTKT